MTTRAAAAAVIALAACAASAHAAERVVADDWYAVRLNGTHAGSVHTRVVADDATRRTVTTTETKLLLARAGSEIELVLASRVEEDAAGRVVAFGTRQKVAASETTTSGVVDGATIRLRQDAGTSELAYPEGALGPAALDRAVLAAGFAPDTVTRLRAFATESPAQASDVAYRVLATEPLRAAGHAGDATLHRVEVTEDAARGRTRTLWLDDAGRLQASRGELVGVGRMETERTTEERACAAPTAVDVLATSFVAPDRTIHEPRGRRHAVLRLARRDGSRFDAHPPEDAGQSVRRADDDAALEVTIDVWWARDGFRAFRRPVQDASLERYLQATPWLETADLDVRALSAIAVGAEADALACTRRIEQFVRRYVLDKTLDVGFATAAETARSRRGDCSEHALLAAALARAAGLPSRVVLGLAYLEPDAAPGVGRRGAFGYHMWAEVLVAADTWVPMDPALGGFDATHLALAKSDLAAGTGTSQLTGPVVDAIRDLRIEVVEVR